ncbi:hypothetical protein ACFCXH_19430 [Streptomyces nojiriensis]|uniref:Uncharacterized protein n=1 Tax=Streptomyces nojiriensis TaxID=66374 RepID=A0ABQ3SVK7_9ACTN|nr:hypothetical protein [Streptomyces nojiriensis]QTI45644.1 hypothetical protein JYK04_03441 [Streptomyces nojiriensis]GGR97426.1 hypothetical protein GCM10010205_27840 [Streptomyces nojiriensis]GHI72112.1 hypothetical protein Snoj_60300 [Streptomyces nojiriensis]
MRVVRASLSGPRADPDQEGVLALVSDLIWAHTPAAHGLEHLRAKAARDGVDVYLFLRAASEAAALTQAHAILDGARAPLRAHGYRTTEPHRDRSPGERSDHHPPSGCP